MFLQFPPQISTDTTRVSVASPLIITILTRLENFTRRYFEIRHGNSQLTMQSNKVITTRSYDERLDTISAVRDAGISVCSGGILGLGESDADRTGLIWEVSK
jgi:hypothetical protein